MSSYFNEKPALVRLLFLILLIYFLTFAAVNFYQFTSRVTDAKNKSGEMFSEEKLSQILLDSAADTASEICQTVVSMVHRFSDESPQFDDQTIVVVKIK